MARRFSLVPPFPRAVWVAAMSMIVAQFPVTLVAASLTRIAADTGLDGSHLQWVQSAFSLTMAAAVLSAGAMAERFGRKRVMLVALGQMAIGALLAGVSALGFATFPLLVGGQLLAGAGAGALLPTSLATITTTLPNELRGAGAALWGAGATSGLASGALVGGLVVSTLPWGFVFVPSGMLAVLTYLAVVLFLEESPVWHAALDVPGQVLATLTVAAIIFGAVSGGDQGWTSPSALVGFSLGGVLLLAFLGREARTPAPIMDLRMFANPRFSAAGLAAAVALFAVVGTSFLVPVYVGSALRFEPMAIAFSSAASPAAALLASPVVGLLMKRFHATTVLVGALLVAGLGLWIVAGAGALAPGAHWAEVVLRLPIFGAGVAAMLASVATVAVNAVPRAQAAAAGATNTVLRQIGGALAPGVIGSVYFGNIAAGATAGESFTLAMYVMAALLVGTAVPPLIANAFPRRMHPA